MKPRRKDRIIAAVCAVLAGLALVAGLLLVGDSRGESTVHAGEWFTDNGVAYRVSVVPPEHGKLTIEVEAENRTNESVLTVQGVSQVLTHAGGRTYAFDCTAEQCMYDELDPHATLLYRFSFPTTARPDWVQFSGAGGDATKLARIEFDS